VSMNRCLSPLVVLLCVLAEPSVARPGGPGPAQAAPRPAATHPITIAETLALSKPSEVQISPGGTQVAYVVTQPILRTNQDHAVLYVSDAARRGPERALAEGLGITTVRWSTNGRWIFFVLENESGREIWRVSPNGGGAEKVTSTRGELVYSPAYRGEGIAYQLSSDGNTLVYAVYDSAEAEREFKARVEGGIVYRGDKWYQQLIDLKWQSALYKLWSYDLRRRRAKEVWETHTVMPPGYYPPEIQISPDGKKVAVLHQTTDDRQYSLDLLDLAGGQVQPFLPHLANTFDLHWNEDGQSLTFDSFGEYAPGVPPAQGVVHYTARLADRSMKPDQDATVASLLGVDSLAQAVEQKTGKMVHNCSVSDSKTRTTCIEEAPMFPPEVVSVTLKGENPDAKPLILTHLNPDYDAIQLGQVSALDWPGPKGEPGPQAGLILPVGYVSGSRYPLIVMLYNTFSGRQFIYQAGLFTSFPAQAFAGHGYAVLLVNLPEGHGVYKEGDFTGAKAAEIENVVLAIRSAVDSLVTRGIVDANRMGIMGWSYGSFCTDYVVTHYPDWFRAAASGEGGLYYPGGYWLTNDSLRTSIRGFFGGGPYGKFFLRWKEISPVLNAERLGIPLLMEYTDVNLSGLEMRQAILEQGGQAELVLYPGEDHVFLQPRNRFNSMTHHYDWFNFWLLGEEDPDLSKGEQYTRWREMREKLKEGRRSSANSN
jgi:dipeptidyl aminopeptidase/acylaminoacyl peptidase